MNIRHLHFSELSAASTTALCSVLPGPAQIRMIGSGTGFGRATSRRPCRGLSSSYILCPTSPSWRQSWPCYYHIHPFSHHHALPKEKNSRHVPAIRISGDWPLPFLLDRVWWRGSRPSALWLSPERIGSDFRTRRTHIEVDGTTCL